MTQDTALGRVLHQVGTGTDALIVGAPAEQAALMARAASALAEHRNVVQVAAPAAGLSLSALMAQLSGRPDLGAHDDSVLEIGFRRLAMPEDGRPTALLLDARAGLQRPVLRYLQHVGRGAPGLALVIAAEPSLLAMLAEPGFAGLQARLSAHAPIVTPLGLEVAEAVALATPIPAPFQPPQARAPSLPAPTTPLSPRTPERRRAVVWPWALGAGMAASVALGAWFGHASRDEPDRSIVASQAAPHVPIPMQQAPLQQAQVPQPNLAPAVAPVAPPSVAPVLAGPSVAAPPEPAALAEAPPATIPTQPEQHAETADVDPRVAATDPGTVDVEPEADRPLPIPPRPALAPRAETRPRAPARPRIASADQPPSRLRTPGLRRPMPEADTFEPRDWARGEPPAYPTPMPWRGARYAPPPEQPYIGTFTTGPYGNRVFRYDQP